MTRKTASIILLSSFPLLLCTANSMARTRTAPQRNSVEVITSKPTLPAEIYDPARERRNHDWLTGYGDGAGNDTQGVGEDNNNDEEAQQSQNKERQHRRHWQNRYRR